MAVQQRRDGPVTGMAEGDLAAAEREFADVAARAHEAVGLAQRALQHGRRNPADLNRQTPQRSWDTALARLAADLAVVPLR